MEYDNQRERDEDDVVPQARASRNKLLLVVAAVAVLLLVALFFYMRSPGVVEPEPAIVVPPEREPRVTAPREPPPPTAPEREVEMPPPAPKPLPPLAESDTVVRNELAEVAQGDRLVPLLVRDELVRKFVRAVHVMATDGTVVHEYRPVVPPAGTIAVERTEEIAQEEINQHYRLLEDNYRRYEPYVNALSSMQPDTLMQMFRRYQPLLEQAFKEQGLEGGNFTQQLITAIDHLLAAPVVEDELILVRPRVFYQYEDPELERLPDAHKLMLRMGPENAEQVKASLRRLRASLVQGTR